MRAHVRALFRQDESGRLSALNVPGGGDAPRFFMGRTAEGAECWFRRDLTQSSIRELSRACDAVRTDWSEPVDASSFCAILERDHSIRSQWAGPTYRFPRLLPATDAVRVMRDDATVLDPYLTEWHEDVSEGQPFLAALLDGHAVSVCCTVRAGPEAHEAGVETHPDFRGRGFAARAVVAWGQAVREAQRTPLYSTSWENEASRALALKASLVQYGSTLHIT